MKRFFSLRIGWFGRIFLGFVAIITVLYIEEDWRGAHDWAVTKAKWESKGESFDYNRFIPPPVPDDQNLGAIPLFRLQSQRQPDGTSTLDDVVLQKAFRQDRRGNELPVAGNWMAGIPPDFQEIRQGVADNFAASLKGVPAPADPLAQLEALYPFLPELRTASAARSMCRFPSDYTSSPPAARSLGLVVAQIKLSRILTLHAILALDHHQSDLALEDIKTTYQLLSGVKRDPTLIGGFVAIGMSAINGAGIYNGLAQHEWSDGQLVELDQTLKPMNFLADFQFSVRAEAAEDAVLCDWFRHARSSDFQPMAFEATATEGRFFRWPGGWWDNNARQLVNFHFQQVATVDAKQRRVYPGKAKELEVRDARESNRWSSYAPWNVWFTEAAPYMTSTMLKFAQAQVWVDEARIACALERYRLAHGVYSDSLAALTPAYITDLPHDVINGEPYHYQLRPDGTFLLYSVGWNEKDDGGQIVYEKANPSRVDYTHGDWVWPAPKYAKPTPN